MDFNQATALWADSKLMYTPKKFMSDVDTFYMGVQVTKDGVASGASDLDASNATPVMTSKVEVMPANIVYYEDNFSNIGTDENIDSKSGIIYSGNVTINGETKTVHSLMHWICSTDMIRHMKMKVTVIVMEAHTS